MPEREKVMKIIGVIQIECKFYYPIKGVKSLWQMWSDILNQNYLVYFRKK